jgi:hypothetical protein
MADARDRLARRLCCPNGECMQQDISRPADCSAANFLADADIIIAASHDPAWQFVLVKQARMADGDCDTEGCPFIVHGEDGECLCEAEARKAIAALAAEPGEEMENG